MANTHTSDSAYCLEMMNVYISLLTFTLLLSGITASLITNTTVSTTFLETDDLALTGTNYSTSSLAETLSALEKRLDLVESARSSTLQSGGGSYVSELIVSQRIDVDAIKNNAFKETFYTESVLPVRYYRDSATPSWLNLIDFENNTMQVSFDKLSSMQVAPATSDFDFYGGCSCTQTFSAYTDEDGVSRPSGRVYRNAGGYDTIQSIPHVFEGDFDVIIQARSRGIGVCYASGSDLTTGVHSTSCDGANACTCGDTNTNTWDAGTYGNTQTIPDSSYGSTVHTFLVRYKRENGMFGITWAESTTFDDIISSNAYVDGQSIRSLTGPMVLAIGDGYGPDTEYLIRRMHYEAPLPVDTTRNGFITFPIIMEEHNVNTTVEFVVRMFEEQN